MEQRVKLDTLLVRYINADQVQREDIFQELRACIQQGADLGYLPEYSTSIPLWIALTCRCDLEVIRLLYDAYPAVMNINVYFHIYSDKENRTYYHQLHNTEYVLVHRYGRHFRSMKDDDIDIIKYVLECLKIMNLREPDINWDWTLQNGIED